MADENEINNNDSSLAMEEDNKNALMVMNEAVLSTESYCEPFSLTTKKELRKNLDPTFCTVSERVARLEEVQHQQLQLHQQANITTITTTSSSTMEDPSPLLASSSSSSSGFHVFLRIRPSVDTSNTIDIIPNSHTTVQTRAPTSALAVDNTSTGVVREYSFSKVLPPCMEQDLVYQQTAAPLVERCLFANDPTSALLLCYGVSNAGKTHTVHGGSSNSILSWGILPRALSEICQRISTVNNNNSLNNKYTYELNLSCLEIYMEQVFDLVPNPVATDNNNKSSLFVRLPKSSTAAAPPLIPLKIRECNGQAIVVGLAQHKIDTIEQALGLIETARRNRHTATNSLNETSSRSHSIYQMSLIRTTKTTSGTTDSTTLEETEADDTTNTTTTTSFWVVDLAGSERSKRTQTMGLRQQEASQINKSLVTLMRCLQALKTNTTTTTTDNPSSTAVSQQQQQLAPYRDSKLTLLLMKHMSTSNNGGAASSSSSSTPQTVMIVNVHPSAADYEETQHVLAYASDAHKLVRPGQAPFVLQQQQQRQKQHYEYDNNGRRVVVVATNPTKPNNTNATKNNNPTKTNKNKTVRLMGRMLQKLSPKPLLRQRQRLQKRKAPPAAAAGPSARGGGEDDEVTTTGTQADTRVVPAGKDDDAKNLNYNDTVAVVASSEATTADESNSNKRLKTASSTSTSTEKEDGNNLHNLQTALTAQSDLCSTLQAENALLQSEMHNLELRLEQAEECIREEVAVEMQAQMNTMRGQYNRVIEQLKNSNTCQRTMSDDTNNSVANNNDSNQAKLEELQQKVQECEDEMARLRLQHQDELERVQQEYLQQQAALNAKLQDESAKVKRLEQSRHELIANYERLLRDDDDDDDEEQDEENEEEQDSNDDIDATSSAFNEGEGGCNFQNPFSIVNDQATTKERHDDNQHAVVFDGQMLAEEEEGKGEAEGTIGEETVEVEGQEQDCVHDNVIMDESSETMEEVSGKVPEGQGENDHLHDDEEEAEKVVSSRRTTLQTTNSASRHRPPMGNVSANTVRTNNSITLSNDKDNTNGNDDASSSSFVPAQQQQWMFPKHKPVQDSATGEYKRPKGRAPNGTEAWDKRKGAWRLSSITTA